MQHNKNGELQVKLLIGAIGLFAILAFAWFQANFVSPAQNAIQTADEKKAQDAYDAHQDDLRSDYESSRYDQESRYDTPSRDEY